MLCQHADNAFVGVNSGIMDQYASLLCQAGTALLIDCRSLEAESVPLDLIGADLTLLVCDTRVSRELGATGYNARREACERAAHTLGIKALRDARIEDLDKLSGEELKRARHVVTENARVLEAGPAEMTTKVLAALPSWKFQPVLRGGQPVEVNAILGFNIDTR